MIFLFIPLMVLLPLAAFLMSLNQWEYKTYVKPKLPTREERALRIPAGSLRVRFFVLPERLHLEWCEWRLGPKCDDPQWWKQRDELIEELEI